MNIRTFFFLLLALMSTQASAQDPQTHKLHADTINAFFSQYSLLGKSDSEEKGMKAFAEQRMALFSKDSKTIIHDDARTEYQGREGHIQSIKDWFAIYSTQDDFNYEIKGNVGGNTVKVELYGTLQQSLPDGEKTVAPDAHKWTEYFTFDESGLIERLQIDMNLLSDSYDSHAREQLSLNDVASFVYQWFAGFDHQRESGFFLQKIAEPVDMYYPDFPVKSYDDFLRWYKGVTDNITWNAHDIQNLSITGNQNDGWQVSYDVNWKAAAKNGDKYDMRVHQKLEVIQQQGQLKIAKLHAEVRE